MPYYKVSDGEYDDYSEEILIHDRQYNEEQFLNMVKESGENGISEVVDFLCEKYSFKRLEINEWAHLNWSESKGPHWVSNKD